MACSRILREAFTVPSPPEVSQPRTPTAAVVTFLSEADVSTDAARIEASAEAWAAGSSGLSTKRCEALQVIELVLSSLALTCWTAMCVLDLSGYWNEPVESEDSLPSHVLSLSVWCVSCAVFIARQSSICYQKDWSHVKSQAAGQSGLYWELLVLLATQWSLISGALAWLVFHAAHQRRMQVIAGLLAVLAMLALLLCTIVYVLREHRNRSKVSSGAPTPNAKAEARPKHEDSKRTEQERALRAQAPEAKAVELSSMTSSVGLADLNRLSFKSHRSSGTHDQEDSLSTSGNYLGKLWSDDGSVSKQSVLKQGVDSMDSDMFSVEGLMSDKSLKQVVFGEMPIRSSRGRWRPLFPSLSESSYSPSASMSCSVASVRKLGSSQKFFFESEEDAQRSLALDIRSHSQHLAVQTAPQLDRSASPCLSMGSQKSHLSVPEAKEVSEAYRRPTTSSALSDVSSRSKPSQQSSFGS